MLKRTCHVSGVMLASMLLTTIAWMLSTESIVSAPLLDSPQMSSNGPGLLSSDVNSDSRVDILDLNIVAGAYGSYKGHSRWNVKADLNDDERINIFDLALVARDFGKIVEASISLKRYTGSGSFEGFDAEVIAEFFDMSQSWPNSGAKIQQVHQIRPDYVALLYRNFPIIYEYADEADLFKSKGWILRDEQGNFAHSTSLGYYWIDVGNPECRTWVAEWIKLYLDRYGFDGVFADNSLAATLDQWFWDVAARPINPRTGIYWTQSDMIEAELAYHDCVKQAIGYKFLICNGIWLGQSFYSYEDTYVRIVSTSRLDGFMSEGIWYKYDGQWLSEEQWKKSLDFLLWTQGTGKIFVPVCSVGLGDKVLPNGCTVQRMYTYAWASTLLGIETSQNYLGSTGTEVFFRQICKPLQNVDVRKPLGNYYVISETGVYARDFAGAKVLVNPSDQAHFVTLDEEYITLDGRVVSNVTMESHSGLLLANRRLLNSNPSAEEDIDENGIPDQWTGWGDNDISPNLEWSDRPCSGMKSLFVSAKLNASAVGWHSTGWAQSFDATALKLDHTYAYRCWYNSDTPIRLVAVFWDRDHNWIENKEVLIPASSGLWKRTEWLIFSFPDSAHSVGLGVGLFNKDLDDINSSWAYLDDFELYDISDT